MEKNIDMCMLYEVYKSLLTANKQDIFEQYYFSDLSLREIGDNNNISFQAVRDSLKKTEKELLSFESKLHVLELKKQINSIYNYILNEDMSNEKIKEELKRLGEF